MAAPKAETALIETGIGVVGEIPWGSHFFLFYETKEDLLDTLVPYFKAGLKNNESYFALDTEAKARGIAAEKIPEAANPRSLGRRYALPSIYTPITTRDISSAAGPLRHAATRPIISSFILDNGRAAVSRTISLNRSMPSVSSFELKLSVKPSV